MNSPFSRQEEIFANALKLPTPAQRRAYLDEACAGDQQLRQHLETLLAAYNEAGTFLQTPADSALNPSRRPADAATFMPVSEKVGDRIGRYKLLQKIGEGGCGVVYMAEQEQPVRRRVALKVIKLGMDTRSVIARFEAERQALAMMDHPNIAKVLDAGATESGRPFFVMELVRGFKITDYCDQNALSTAERLKLFTQVCHAIQHAHQKGVIHRDIKPSNVLVTENDGVPVPKVIDFGIAKATNEQRLTDKTVFTAFEQFIGTPAYMSPEQAAMTSLDIDTRSDIYSLGVLLYEFLTGKTPFDPAELMKAGVDEIRRTIRDEEPPRPSTRLSTLLEADLAATAEKRHEDAPHLINLLRGDLDWIVMKCLEKDRQRRYETANGLASDIQRHLKNEPVIARPPSAAYRFQKMVRRNKLVFAAAASVVAVLILGIVVSTWQAVKFSRLRVKAEANEQKAVRAQAEGTLQRLRAEEERSRADAARGLAQRRLYAAQMSQAFRAWENGNLNLAHALLNAQRPRTGEADLRGTDWRWLWSLCQSEAKAVLPTQGEFVIITAEPSPDGRRFATAGWSTNVVIYDLAGKDKPQVLRGHRRMLTGWRAVAFSPDGTHLASASGGLLQNTGPCELFLWDLATTNKTVLEGHDAWLWSVAFSPDGVLLASACLDGTVGLWDGHTGRNLAILRGHRKAAYVLAFSKDGQRLFSGGEDGTVRRWDVAARREVGPPLQHELPVYRLAVAPDDRLIATACFDNYLHLWDTTSLHERNLRYGPAEHVNAPAFSPDGGLLAFGTANNIRLWDLQRDQEKTVLRGSPGVIVNLRFLPDGRHLVSANEFEAPRLWDIQRPEKVITLQGFREGVRSLAVSADQRWLVVGSDNFYEPQRPGQVSVFDLATQQPLRPPLEHPQGVKAVCLSPNGMLVATGCADGAVRIFTIPDGQLIRTLSNAVPQADWRWRHGLVFSPDGQSLVTCGDAPAQISVWDTATWQGKPLLRDPPGLPEQFAFSRDGSLLVTPMETDFTIVWNMPSGTTNKVLRNTKESCGAAFSWDGTMLALQCGLFDIELFHAKTWEHLGTLKGHEHGVNGMAFAPDGKILASVGTEGSVRLWSVPGCEEVAALYDHRDSAETVAFTPDGQWLISGSRDKTVKLRRIPSFEQIQAAESATHRVAESRE